MFQIGTENTASVGKGNKNVGTEPVPVPVPVPVFIRYVPKKVYRPLWTCFGTERVKLERIKYHLDL